MAIKYRARNNYAQVYDGAKQGYNLGIDSEIYLKRETTPRVFEKPSIGTQGASTGANAADTDISAGTDNALKVAVDGGAVVDVVLAQVGKNTGLLIAAELESKINAALLAAGQDGRVWVEFLSGPTAYKVYSQKTGTQSSVVITNATLNNVADDLGLGVANSGTEAAGTNDTDYLLYTSGGPTFTQPIVQSAHRAGRGPSGFIKQKKVLEWSLSTYVNMLGSAGDSIDAAVSMLWEQLTGTKEIVPGTAIRFKRGLPSFYYSMVRVSTIFGEYVPGCYGKEMTLTFPGDGPATNEWSGRGKSAVVAGIAKVLSIVTASATVPLVADQQERFEKGAYVMAIDTDGRTILAGADGSITISDIVDLSSSLVLSSAVSLPAGALIVPWSPGAVQLTARENIFTDLEGQVQIDASLPTLCVTNLSLAFNNNHTDLDNCFGSDGNDGFVAGGKMEATLSMTFDLSNENWAQMVQARKFNGFSPVIYLGSAGGRRLKIEAPKWVPNVPPVDVPESGPTSVTMEGILYPTSPGAGDEFTVTFL